MNKADFTRNIRLYFWFYLGFGQTICEKQSRHGEFWSSITRGILQPMNEPYRGGERSTTANELLLRLLLINLVGTVHRKSNFDELRSNLVPLNKPVLDTSQHNLTLNIIFHLTLTVTKNLVHLKNVSWTVKLKLVSRPACGKLTRARAHTYMYCIW